MRIKTANSLHEAMHRIPGVPPHRVPQAGEINGGNRHHGHQYRHHQQQQQHGHQEQRGHQEQHGHQKQPHRLRLPNQTSHHDTPPRVLVAWQNKIGELFRRKP
jgi:hypothetical protein